MAFAVSPSVTINEKDASTFVAGVATTIGAYAGKFRWGSAFTIESIGSEGELLKKFGRPTNDVAVDFFTCASFLAYANSLRSVRVVDASLAKNASSGTAVYYPNDDLYGAALDAGLTANNWIGKYVGELGNSLHVSSALGATLKDLAGAVTVTNASTAVTGTGFTANVAVGDSLVINGVYYLVATVTSNTALVLATAYVGTSMTGIVQIFKPSKAFSKTLTGTLSFTNGSATVTGSGTSFTTELVAGDFLVLAGRRYQILRIVSATSLVLTKNYNLTTVAGATVIGEWQFAGAFTSAPGTNEVHLVVIDQDGLWNGTVGEVLETYGFLSTVAGTKKEDGSLNYYVDVLRRTSSYILFGGIAPSSIIRSEEYDLAGGVDSFATIDDGDRISGYDLFNDPDVVDVSLLIAGEASGTLASYIIQNIAEVRKDCVAFVSPGLADVVGNAGNEVADTITYRNSLPSSSYGFLDSGWKYMFDRYNDVYRWIPLNGDTAGLTARTEFEADAWFSPAGLNRGSIKNVTKLAYNPTRPQRDDLYKNGINPVVDFPGSGTVLFGDKTLLAKPSAFDRINVRRLFIVMEKAIANFSKFSLFEFNDEFTRASFVAAVEPFLRTIKGRRGIFDFLVVCDTTNNTPDVIDRNEFVGDIYVKAAKSVNFITLNFIAVRTGASFSEVVGKV